MLIVKNRILWENKIRYTCKEYVGLLMNLDIFSQAQSQ